MLWSLAIRHAILYAEFDVRAGLAHLDRHATAYWTQRLGARRSRTVRSRPVPPNGWVVTALQAAWSAILYTPVPEAYPCQHLCDGLSAAIGIDDDTVAAITGALLGARWSASVIPAEWRRISHGYPSLTGERLVELAHLAACGGQPGAYGWPTVDHIDYSGHGVPLTLVRHPHDDGVWLADASALDDLPDDVTAVVSLCLVGRRQIRPDLVHVNRVVLHCVAAQRRTPTVAIAYAMHRGIKRDMAYRSIRAALPSATPNPGSSPSSSASKTRRPSRGRRHCLDELEAQTTDYCGTGLPSLTCAGSGIIVACLAHA